MERVTRSGNKLQRKRRFRQPSPPPGQGIDQHLHSKRPKNSSPKSSPSAASPLRVAGSSSNPSPDEGASTAEEERKKKKKIRGKRAELEDLLRCDGYAGAAAATELRRWGLTASIRRKGSWKGGIELSYRLDGTLVHSWREVQTIYSHGSTRTEGGKDEDSDGGGSVGDGSGSTGSSSRHFAGTKRKETPSSASATQSKPENGCCKSGGGGGGGGGVLGPAGYQLLLPNGRHGTAPAVLPPPPNPPPCFPLPQAGDLSKLCGRVEGMQRPPSPPSSSSSFSASPLVASSAAQRGCCLAGASCFVLGGI